MVPRRQAVCRAEVAIPSAVRPTRCWARGVVPTRRTYVAVPLRLRVPALLIGLWLALAAWPASAAYVSRVTATRIEVERLPRHRARQLLAGGTGDGARDTCVVEVKGRRAQCRLVAGTVYPGDETESIASAPVRLAPPHADNPQAPAIAGATHLSSLEWQSFGRAGP